jgi:hypothetical protein
VHIRLHHAYAYLLGMYLGDGHIVAMHRGVYQLRLYLDAKYPVIVDEAAAAVALVNPSRRSGVYSVQRDRLKIVSGYSKSWPRLFPQHGPGSSTGGKSSWPIGNRRSVDASPIGWFVD